MNEETQVFDRNPFAHYPVVARGEGVSLCEEQGKR